jgi:hypothetical protein
MLNKIQQLLVPPKPSIHPTPQEAFHSDNYLRHTARRLEHLASLGIPVAGKRVLDVSSGIGDHARYYMDRGCKVTMTEVREENLEVLRKRFPGEDIQHLDLESPTELEGSPFEVIHCYGLLYHLGKPDIALDYVGGVCSEILFLETCVTPGNTEDIHPVKEDPGNPTWAVSGEACRPTRPWIFNRLRRHFKHVYLPSTQPNHPHFPIEWKNLVPNDKVLTRAIFVASQQPLTCPALLDHIPDTQTLHP